MKNYKTFLSIALATVSALTTPGCQDQEVEPNKPGLLVPRTVDQDPSLPQLSINGTRLHVETFGDPSDPMIVALHGGPGEDYRSMLKCKEFTNHGYFVVFYDQRGSGLSQRHPKNTYNIDVMIEDLRAIIQHHHHSTDQKIFLLGHSWGAMLATAYIDRYPENVDGAILAEPGGFTWKDTEAYISRTAKGRPLSEDASDAFYFDQILTGKEDEHAILDYKASLAAAHENAKGNVIGNAGPTPFWRRGSAVNTRLLEIADNDGFDFTRNLDQYTTKVLFLYSELNTAYGPNHAQLVSSAFPDVQLRMIRGTGHEILFFGWQHFSSTALEYLNARK